MSKRIRDYDEEGEQPVEKKIKIQPEIRRYSWRWSFNEKHGRRLEEFKAYAHVLSDIIKKVCGPKSKFMFQLEESAGNHWHFQGALDSQAGWQWSKENNQIAKSFSHFLPGMELSAAKDYAACVRYGSKTKDPTYRLGPWDQNGSVIPEEEFDEKSLPVESLPWQQQIIEFWPTKPDNRTVFWNADVAGCQGRSTLAKLLAVKKLAFIVPYGTARDMSYQLYSNPTSRMYIFDLTRSLPKGDENAIYAVIEQLKSGIIQSDKYEGGTKFINPPHIFVFSNKTAKKNALSGDRVRPLTISSYTGKFLQKLEYPISSTPKYHNHEKGQDSADCPLCIYNAEESAQNICENCAIEISDDVISAVTDS